MTSFAESVLAELEPGVLIPFEPQVVGPRGTMLDLCRAALRGPVGAEPLARARAGTIAIIISDASRDEPRADMLSALLEVLPRDRVTLFVASGTHRASADVVPAAFRDLPVVVHDAERLDGCLPFGTTREGTPVHLRADVAHADLIIVTGRLRPHYFAGYSGGVKGLFPGCAHREGILINHRLKSDPTCRLGRVDDNRCRLDMEDAALRVPGEVFILDVLADCDGHPVAAVAGHPVLAHRHLASQARELFVVRAPRSPVVVVADRPPVSRSLYQASKLLPPAGPLLEDGGTVVVVADCVEGIEPIERVNEGIYGIGVARQLPPHEVVLVSELPRETVQKSYARPAESLRAALDAAAAKTGYTGPVPLIWRAGEAIGEAAGHVEGTPTHGRSAA